MTGNRVARLRDVTVVTDDDGVHTKHTGVNTSVYDGWVSVETLTETTWYPRRRVIEIRDENGDSDE